MPECLGPEPKPKSRSWLDKLHTGLDLVGLVPGLSEWADGLNALIYLGEGDYKNAALSAVSLVPFGDIAKIGKAAGIVGGR